MFDGIGFGYMADGLLKGQERNREWSLRQKQEERRQAAEDRENTLFPIQVDNAKAQGVRLEQQNKLGAEGLTPEALERRRKEGELGLGIKKEQLNNIKNQGIGIAQENEIRAEGLTPAAKEFRQKNQAQEMKAKRLQNQYNEYRNTLLGRKVFSESLAWDKKIEQTVNQTNSEKAKLELAQVLDLKYYRMLQLLDSGDSVGAAMMFNESKTNPHQNITRFEKTKDGGVIGYDADGNRSIDFDANEIKGLRSRVSQRLRGGKSDQPKVIAEPVFDDMGQKVGEKSFVVKTDPQTGTPYKQYIEEKPQFSANQQEEVELAKTLVKAGEMSPETFKKMYGQDYDPSTSPASTPNRNNVQVPRPSNSGGGGGNNKSLGLGDPDIPLIF